MNHALLMMTNVYTRNWVTDVFATLAFPYTYIRSAKVVVNSTHDLLMKILQLLGPLPLVTSVPIASTPNPHLCASSVCSVVPLA